MIDTFLIITNTYRKFNFINSANISLKMHELFDIHGQIKLGKTSQTVFYIILFSLVYDPSNSTAGMKA